jgi:alpha-ketoglutarate-dependent taurine dioxygenase
MEVADGLALVQSLGAAVVGAAEGEGEGEVGGSSSGAGGGGLVYGHKWERGDFVIWDNRVGMCK